MEDTIKINEHLTLEDFNRIFDQFSGTYMWDKWCRCNKVEGVFRLCLATNEVLAWDRAIAGYYEGIQVTRTLFYN